MPFMFKKKVRANFQGASLKSLIDKDSKLPLRTQCEILGISRTSLYYSKIKKDESFLEEEIVKVYMDKPFYGYRKVHKELSKKINVSEKKVRSIKKRLNLITLYPGVKTTVANKEHEKFPYLLKKMDINRVNQVWQADITYLKLKSGFVFLSAIIDVFSRKILSYNISNTMDVNLCASALKEAIATYGIPEIANSDQGSQYTSLEYVNILKQNKVRISMNSKGRALDNIFIERFFRSLKYEDVYLKKYETLTEAKAGIARYMNFYNSERTHQSLDYLTPDELYYDIIEKAVDF